MRLFIMIAIACTLAGCASRQYAQITGSTTLHDRTTAETICRGEVARTSDDARGSSATIMDGCMAREGYATVQ